MLNNGAHLNDNYLQQFGNGIRLLSVRSTVTIRITRHKIRTSLHQLSMKHDSCFILARLWYIRARAVSGGRATHIVTGETAAPSPTSRVFN